MKVLTVNEVSKLTGVSVRTLHYYDEIGLLAPAMTTETGYRLYNEESLKRLQQILLYRELEFPLKEIKTMLNSPDFDAEFALYQQLELLKLKKERLERLVELAEEMKNNGVRDMSFKAFDRGKIESYKEEAKMKWGDTVEYKECEKKTADYSADKQARLAGEMMGIFAELGAVRHKDPASPEVQALVKRLQDFITANYYNCTNRIFLGLGQLYCAGGELTENIDAAGGEGTARFAAEAITVYCG